MHEAIFADVEIPRTGSAAPVIWLRVGNGFLELVELRVVLLFPAAPLVPHRALFAAQRLQLAISIVDDADGGSKAQLNRTTTNRQRILGILNAAANHGVDVHMEVGILREPLQLLV